MNEPFDNIAHTLSRGQEYPYDCDCNGKAEPAPDWAHEAARGVLYDLNDRGGIKHGFRDIDADIRREIIETIASIIRLAHANSGKKE